MRILAVVVVVALAAGCFGAGNDKPAEPAELPCLAQTTEIAYYFAAGHTLVNGTPPAEGSEPGNAFSSAFLTTDLKEWLSGPVVNGLRIDGNVTLDYWVRSNGSPAPLVLGGPTGEAYHFFNQFGTDRTFQPATAREFSTFAPPPGTIDHYTEVLAMPPGGFFVETGDRLRVLLTDLALDGTSGSGHDVLYGGETPSQIRFSAVCIDAVRWHAGRGFVSEKIDIQANQGLLTGAVPAGDTNRQDVGIIIENQTQRITVTLTQTNDRNPVKDDVDIEILAGNGTVVWSIGSPYSDEAGTLWGPNLDAVGLRGTATVRVNSYSGLAYTGDISVVQEVSHELPEPY